MGSLTEGTGQYIDNLECGIRDVWDYNLDEEFRKMVCVCRNYRFVAMDTEFPGVVARPVGEFRSTADYQYQLLRCNVDLLKIIQIGITFYDEAGNTPKSGITTWQFNFKFSLGADMYAQDSIDLLQNSGIQFRKHEDNGIDSEEFAAQLMMSGLVLMDNIKWLSFHSGYDFGYMLKLLTNKPLPASEAEFFELLRVFFPCIYDVKYLMKSCKNLKGGLQEVAEQLELERIGPQHQAGSDSLLTGASFFKMRELFFEDNIDDAKYCGHLYGLGTSYLTNGAQYPEDTIINGQQGRAPVDDLPGNLSDPGTNSTSGGGGGGGGRPASSSLTKSHSSTTALYRPSEEYKRSRSTTPTTGGGGRVSGKITPSGGGIVITAPNRHKRRSPTGSDGSDDKRGDDDSNNVEMKESKDIDEGERKSGGGGNDDGGQSEEGNVAAEP